MPKKPHLVLPVVVVVKKTKLHFLISEKVKILSFDKVDWSSISRIYQQGLDTGIASFELKIPTWQQWDITHHKFCRFKAVIEDKIVGWAALSPTSTRQVYRGVAEVSIYISSEHRGMGVGKSLLQRLIQESEKEHIWTLQASIFNQNKASIALHTAVGFRTIGYRQKVAKRLGVWHDNIILERRSNIIT